MTDSAGASGDAPGLVAGAGVALQDRHGQLAMIQVIRAVAALLVVATHGSKEVLATDPGPVSPLWSYVLDRGQFGVDLFFVVSGFILAHISRTRLGVTGYPQRFLIRRIARVVPVYWFYTTAMLAVMLAASPAVNHRVAGFFWILGSYCFVPLMNSSDGTAEPVLGVGWTLNYEMYFYVVLFVAMVLFRAKALVAVLIYFAAVISIGWLLRPADLALSVWTDSLSCEFSYGILIALVFGRQFHLCRSAAAVLFVAGVLAWSAIGLEPGFSLIFQHDYDTLHYRGFLWGIPAGLIVASMTLRTASERAVRGPLLRAWVRLGDTSYSLYLVHLFVMRVLTMLFRHAPGTLGGAYSMIYFVAFVAASIAAAAVSYRLLERPADRAWANGLEAFVGRYIKGAAGRADPLGIAVAAGPVYRFQAGSADAFPASPARRLRRFLIAHTLGRNE